MLTMLRLQLFSLVSLYLAISRF